MMLVELLKHAQFITFNKIRKYKYTELFNNIILEKKSTYRKKGLELIDECVKEISKRDRSEQSNMLSKIYSDIFKEKQQNDVDSEVNCGVMMVLKSLLTYANKEIFEENFFLDTPVEDFISLSKSKFLSLGKIKSVEKIVAENNLRGSFKVIGENGTLEIYFTLTPEKTPLIQQLDFL